MEQETAVIEAIDNSPLNRGLRGIDWLSCKGNVPIVMEDDIALFDDEGDCIYQVHFLFKSRGRAAVASAKESFRRMFEDYGAELIFGLVPAFRKDVNLVARWAGGKLIGRRETDDGPCDLFILSRDMWSKA